jgi:3-oxoacyl-[acyl-carrier protein] reductase
VSESLLRRGYNVVGCSRTVPDWEAEGFTHFRADVTDEQQVKCLFERIAQDHQRLDAVVNNAGVASMNHVLLTPMSTVRRILDTNLCGAFLISREAAKLMRRHRYGRIVNLSTVAVPLRLAGEAAYVASKAAVVSLSQVLARELAEFGITVNVVGPGPIETDLIRNVPKEKISALVSSFPIKRLSTFEDIFNVIEFFLRPESAAITGQVIYLGGVPN